MCDQNNSIGAHVSLDRKLTFLGRHRAVKCRHVYIHPSTDQFGVCADLDLPARRHLLHPLGLETERNSRIATKCPYLVAICG